MIATKDYYLDENSQLVPDGDKAAFLLVRKGQEITADIAAKYKLSGAKDGAATDSTAQPAGDKVLKSPDVKRAGAETKMKSPTANK